MEKKYNLPDGLRVLHLPSTSQVAYCGIAVAAGSCQETSDEQGLAHFCEHLTFKGTQRRTATRILNDIEGLGGELNAFTNKEDTVFYCAIERRHLRRAIDVLTDIVFHSQFPQTEVEKEREVVCDEIESYEDSPAELIYDDFDNILFEGHPLGHNILGTSERVRSYNSDNAKRFTAKWYRPENCVLFVSSFEGSEGGVKGSERGVKGSEGGVKGSERGVKGSEGGVKGSEGEKKGQKLSSLSLPHHSPVTPFSLHTTIIKERGTHQAHVMLGTHAYSTGDDRRWSLYLLNNILGGPALNSRLSLALRERNGLVYSVESTMGSYSDTGIWTVYFGCDPADINRCLRLVRRELDKLMEHPLTERQLMAAKRQLQGQLLIAAENREQMTLDTARTFLHTGRVRTLDDVLRHINALTTDDLLATAQQLFAPESLTTLIYK